MSLFKQIPQVSLFFGGARSGKSAMAELYCLNSNLTPNYFATARIEDAEMELRIESHQQSRGKKWHTKETPLDLVKALGTLNNCDVVLIDCLTLWLSNIMFAEADIELEQARLLTAMQNCAAKVVCVSNELGMGLVPETRLGRQFRDAQGVLNQSVAAIATQVVFVAAGLPLILKGNPQGGKNDH
ncbi:MAG: bifunctional adenosylcobinamide kinase/adenosylcobinamide-phosphate guanylyltransferase [Rhodobacteraceae bacterium]|nr:bifunctional adenosylcobinamide kinase/adenosylcobinamide-phosphate guanylyltransferase [Paracoccaceae bacterium]